MVAEGAMVDMMMRYRDELKMELEGGWLYHFAGCRSGGLACGVGESAIRFDVLAREVRHLDIISVAHAQHFEMVLTQ